MNEPFEGFWSRLKIFVENVEVSDAMSEEENGMILQKFGKIHSLTGFKL